MRVLAMAVVMVLPLLLTGCGEKPSVTVYKKGEYQGRGDTQPWAGEPFKGDRLAWERAIKARSNNQSEYSRAASK